MDPNERFLELRPKILADAEFMENLGIYAFTDRMGLIGSDNVKLMSGGQNNYHARIGCLDGLWLVAREHHSIIKHDDDGQRIDKAFYEDYISSGIWHHNGGKIVPVVIGGVGVEDKSGKRLNHFLLVEDLTNNGTSNFVPAGKNGKVFGTLNGKEVYHDFDERGDLDAELNYMSDDKLLIVRE
jgi:hypothetical protein